MRVDLPIWKGRRFFPERIINPRGNADATCSLLCGGEIGKRQNERDDNKPNLHINPQEHLC